MTEPTDAELDMLIDDVAGLDSSNEAFRKFARAVLAKWGTPPAVVGEPFCYVSVNKQGDITRTIKRKDKWTNIPLYTTPQPTQAQAGAVPLTGREIELIDGMIQVQLDHASRCDAIANRSMADKQKGWDMERVALLQKIKAHGIKGGQHVGNVD